MDHSIPGSMTHEDITDHVAFDRGLNQGITTGGDAAKLKIIELMDEVIEAYTDMPVSDQEQANHKQVQTNAVRFMRSWVLSGGQEDFDGNRMCLPW